MKHTEGFQILSPKAGSWIRRKRGYPKMLDTKTEQKWPLTVRVVSWWVKGHFFLFADADYRPQKSVKIRTAFGRPTYLLYQISCRVVNRHLYILAQICEIYKSILFVLYNIPYWFFRTAVLFYSHKRWYRCTGKTLKAQSAKTIVEGNISHPVSTQKRCVIRQSVKCGEQDHTNQPKTKATVGNLKQTPKGTFSLRTCDGKLNA